MEWRPYTVAIQHARARPGREVLADAPGSLAPGNAGHQTPSAAAFGEPLDLKFEYARSAELLTGEAPLAQFFQPAAYGLRRFLWFRRNESSAGDLVLVTSRRLLWITERRNGRYERYGTVGHSARLTSIIGMRYVPTDRRAGLEIAFRFGDACRVPLREDQKQEAQRFEAAARSIL